MQRPTGLSRLSDCMPLMLVMNFRFFLVFQKAHYCSSETWRNDFVSSPLFFRAEGEEVECYIELGGGCGGGSRGMG
jgi:hypothetical protein